MSAVPGQDSDVHFGSVDNESPDWRADEDLANEVDPDDEELDETPEDVIAILGFDPKDL